MIKGLNHITIAASNLNVSFEFYKDVLGFKPLMKHPKGAYFLAGDLWFCLELDQNVRTKALPEDTHYAFTVDNSGFKELSEKIINSGAELWKKNTSEGSSLYFLDPDKHKLEIHCGNWESRIKSAKENCPYKEVLFFD